MFYQGHLVIPWAMHQNEGPEREEPLNLVFFLFIDVCLHWVLLGAPRQQTSMLESTVWKWTTFWRVEVSADFLSLSIFIKLSQFLPIGICSFLNLLAGLGRWLAMSLKEKGVQMLDISTPSKPHGCLQLPILPIS